MWSRRFGRRLRRITRTRCSCSRSSLSRASPTPTPPLAPSSSPRPNELESAKWHEMEGGVAVEKEELIKWYDALDACSDYGGAEKMVEMARDCQHPDAQ